MDTNFYENRKIPSNIESFIADLTTIMGDNAGLLKNRIEISGIKCVFLSFDGMASLAIMTPLVLNPLEEIEIRRATPYELKNHIKSKLILSTDSIEAFTYGDLLRRLMSGFVFLFIDGTEGVLGYGIQGYERRMVGEPEGETDIKGGREGFTETLNTNISLIRRRMKTPDLRFERFVIGKKSKTDVAFIYLKDKTDRKMLREMRKKLSSVELETVLSSGYIRPFLESDKFGFFDTVGTTERPDVLCGKILEGRIAMLIDGSPYALIVPYLFIENFQTLDDYASRPFYAFFIRMIKIIGFFISILLPGVYVAIATFHPEFFNEKLLLILAEAESGAPLPLFAEAFIMLLLYELIKESAIRLPRAIGSAVSIIGGFIIGDAAVSSGIVSNPLLIAVALSVTASFVIPSLTESTTLLRFIFLAAGSLFGLYGIATVLSLVLFNITSEDNMGVPYFSPITPFSLRSMGDTAIRLPLKKLQKRNFNINSLREE